MITNNSKYQVIEYNKQNLKEPTQVYNFTSKTEALEKYHFLRSYELLDTIYIYQFIKIRTIDITNQIK